MAITNNNSKGAALSLKIDGVEYNMDLKSANLTPEEADSGDVTFASLSTGGAQDWFLDIEAFSDYATGSMWEYIWSNAGTTDVDYVVAPYGNATASITKPHFEGTLTIPAPLGIGGTAGETFTFEARFKVDGKPTKVTA